MMRLRSKRVFPAVLTIGALLGSPVAADTVLKCKLSSVSVSAGSGDGLRRFGDFEITVRMDRNGQTATVEDPITVAAFGGPVPVQFRQKMDGSYTLDWTVFEKRSDKTQRPRILFSAAIPAHRQRITIRVLSPLVAGSLPISEVGFGPCKTVN